MKTIAVIIAGGSGTRFWPSSRRALPKQFLKLSGDDSLITDTQKRVAGVADEVMVACGESHVALAQQHLGLTERGLIVEPKARNTAPAIALAVRHVLSVVGDAVMFILPADHFVRDVPAFRDALMLARDACQDGSIVTLGIKPDRPETGYGYIEQGAAQGNGVFAVSRFVEKPPLEEAKKYLAAGNYAWNAGIFVFKASAMWAALEQHAPDVAAPLKEWTPGKPAAALKEAFDKTPSVSIDYAVMEKAKNVKVIPTACGWSDVGSWDALAEVRAADAFGNVVSGNALLVGTKNTVVFNTSGKKVCVLGMDNVIVVETGDTVLVMPRGEGQRVREVVDALAKSDPNLL